MRLWEFYARNSQEVLGLVGQHLYLVAISTGAAIVIGVPLGVLLTRRPAWRGPVLGMANVFQTRSGEHTSELQSRSDLVCRLLLEKKKPQLHAVPDLNRRV